MTKKSLQKRAEQISDYANECCHRSDGYREDVEKVALAHLQEGVSEVRSALKNAIEGLTRYDPVACNDDEPAYAEMAESPIGQFVRLHDVLNLLRRK